MAPADSRARPPRPQRRTNAEISEETRGCDLLLDAYGEPEIQTILLRDAPVVLGWTTWHRMQESAGLVALLRHALEHWVEARWITTDRAELRALVRGLIPEAARGPRRPPDTPLRPRRGSSRR